MINLHQARAGFLPEKKKKPFLLGQWKKLGKKTVETNRNNTCSKLKYIDYVKQTKSII